MQTYAKPVAEKPRCSNWGFDPGTKPPGEPDLMIVRWHTIQRRWLDLPQIKRHIALVGWRTKVLPLISNVTFADIRDTVYPNWQRWFAEQLDGAETTMGASEPARAVSRVSTRRLVHAKR